MGWINPKLDDLIVSDARDGFNVDAICLRRQCDKRHVVALLRRAAEFEFITTEEADVLDLYSEERAA
jgi:hypothetical protein